MIQKITFLNLRPGEELQARLDGAYARVMNSGIYLNGLETEVFSHEWAEYCNRRYCILTASGLDALKLVLRAWDIGVGAEVLIPYWGCVQTWLAVKQLGAVPVPYTRNYDSPTGLFQFEFAIPVHLYGALFSTEMMKYNSSYLLNDACQAHGLKGIGDPAVYSFYPTKNLGAFGDGGAIVTDDKELFDTLLKMTSQSSKRMDELQCAFLREKLPHLNRWNNQRWLNAEQYLAGLKNVTLPDNLNSVWHQFVIQHPERDRLKVDLFHQGIETMIHYPIAPHRQLGYDYDLPEADRLAKEVLSLPIGKHLNERDIEYVIGVVNEIV